MRDLPLTFTDEEIGFVITLTPKQLARWKEVFAKDGIHYKTDEEYVEAVNNLVGYFDVLIQMDLQQKDTAL